MAQKVNPNLFPRAWIGKHKPLPWKKTLTEYYIDLEEALSDIMEGDPTYLKRLLLDAKVNNVHIRSFRTLRLRSSIGAISASTYLYVKENRASVRISVKSYKTIDIYDDRISQGDKMPECIQRKVEEIHCMLKDIAKAYNECD